MGDDVGIGEVTASSVSPSILATKFPVASVGVPCRAGAELVGAFDWLTISAPPINNRGSMPVAHPTRVRRRHLGRPVWPRASRAGPRYYPTPGDHLLAYRCSLPVQGISRNANTAGSADLRSSGRRSSRSMVRVIWQPARSRMEVCYSGVKLGTQQRCAPRTPASALDPVSHKTCPQL
jgi:hypothetical protein